jgi:hypothetical protein
MRAQKRSVLFAFFSLAMAWAVLPADFAGLVKGQAQQVKPNPMMLDCGVIDEIDECIQARFNKVDGTFGLARVAPPINNVHIRNFQLETDAERSAVAALQHAGWRVIFYLAGRQVLEPAPEYPGPDGKPYRVPHFGVQGPVSITPIREQLTRPDMSELRAYAQQAFAAFAKQDRYDFSIGKLAYTARPIRAQEVCLQCHNDKPTAPRKIEDAKEPLKLFPLRRENLHAYSKTPLKVGDALGAAIYAYTKTKQ